MIDQLALAAIHEAQAVPVQEIAEQIDHSIVAASLFPEQNLATQWPPCVCGSAFEAHDWLFLTCPSTEGIYRPTEDRR